MVLYWLLAIALLLFAWSFREYYTDTESPISGRPSLSDPAWRSKIDAEAPIGGNDEDYVKVLQAFHDKVYVPAEVKPKDTDVEAFLQTADAQVAGVDPNAIRKIIGTGFRIEKTLPSAAREEAQIKFQATEALQPKDGIDQVYNRKENAYIPADSRKGNLPEGLYAPVNQQAQPRNPGIFDDKSTSWTQTSFFSVCKPGEPCAENVL
jgi:hypothetical protein